MTRFDPQMSELGPLLRNVHVYAVTPFRTTDVLEIDFDAMGRNLEFLANSGVQVVAVGGGTGEIETLSDDELIGVTEFALSALAGRALVVPCLPENLSRAIRLAREYERLGAQIALACPPLIRWRIPADLVGVVEYYALLAQHTELPLAPYNTQEWPLEIFERLSDVPNIIAIKDPCRAPHALFRAIKSLGDRFVWIGNKQHDPGVLHLRYQMGIEGFTSGQGNFLPGPELEMHVAAQTRDWQRMIELQELVAPLARARAASDDAAMVKSAMDMVGLHGGQVRPPRRNLSVEEKQSLEQTVNDVVATFESAHATSG